MNAIPGNIKQLTCKQKYHNIIVFGIRNFYSLEYVHIVSYKNLMASGWSVILFLIFGVTKLIIRQWNAVAHNCYDHQMPLTTRDMRVNHLPEV